MTITPEGLPITDPLDALLDALPDTPLVPQVLHAEGDAYGEVLDQVAVSIKAAQMYGECDPESDTAAFPRELFAAIAWAPVLHLTEPDEVILDRIATLRPYVDGAFDPPHVVYTAEPHDGPASRVQIVTETALPQYLAEDVAHIVYPPETVSGWVEFADAFYPVSDQAKLAAQLRKDGDGQREAAATFLDAALDHVRDPKAFPQPSAITFRGRIVGVSTPTHTA